MTRRTPVICLYTLEHAEGTPLAPSDLALIRRTHQAHGLDTAGLAQALGGGR